MACQSAIPKYNAARFTPEDFRSARKAWREDICGSPQTNDPSQPGVARLLALRDEDSEDLRAQMHREKDAVILFGQDPPVESKALAVQYDHILRIAFPYGTLGCRGYKSTELLADILYALDWMHDHMYGANILSDSSFRSYRIFNWWEWYVGGPSPMLETLMIIEEDTDKALKDKYLLPIDFIRTQMRVVPEERMSRIIILTPLALLHEDRALLQAMYLDEEILLDSHTSGHCTRSDWCSLTHGVPYNINYGNNNLVRVAKVMRILQRSPVAFTCPNRYNLMYMARYMYAPCLYRGQGLHMMNERFMQMDGVSVAGAVLKNLNQLFGLFGEEEDREIYQLIHRNSTPEIVTKCLGNTSGEMTLQEYRQVYPYKQHPNMPEIHLPTYSRFRDALLNSVWDVEDNAMAYMWYSGDCGVQHRNGCAFALRMCSARVPGYECINGANRDGWYTGDGMLYLYTPTDPKQYGATWWECVNKYHMPGTTVDPQERLYASIDVPYKNNQHFVGGVALESQFLAASMDLESFHCEVDEGRPDNGYGRSLPLHKCSLVGCKSYFLFDRAAVMLGAAIRAQDGFDVKTIVENRLLAPSMRELRVNGSVAADSPFEMSRDDVRSVHIPGVAGYVFPQGGRLGLKRSETEGGTFFECWLDHGVNPSDGKYAYILLPDADADTTAAYAEHPGAEILANEYAVQAARETESGLVGIVFRQAARLAAVHAAQPMILLLHEQAGKLGLSACDPTQKLESFEFILERPVHAISTDPCITVKQQDGGVLVHVDCDFARGRGYCAEFTVS